MKYELHQLPGAFRELAGKLQTQAEILSKDAELADIPMERRRLLASANVNRNAAKAIREILDAE